MSASPGFGLSTIRGATVVGCGTDSARVMTPGVSGERPSPPAHLTTSVAGSPGVLSSRQLERPESSWERTQLDTFVSDCSVGSTTRWRMVSGMPDERSVSATSPSANWFPAEPFSVLMARI
ncbi:Uncharacterised protein [Mycobacteroides abscessus subsp. abscessus]|nr:Uncharacterised protein [Mycobacteroides abscessus subsp. abscessus]